MSQRFFYLFYPKNFTFNSKTNALAGIVFVLYCLENLFVISAILDKKPIIYFRSNAVALLTGIICYTIVILTKNLNEQTCLICLAIMQFAMCLVSILTYKNLFVYFNNNIIIGLGFVSIILLVVNFLNISLYLTLGLSLVLLFFAGCKVFGVLKNLY